MNVKVENRTFTSYRTKDFIHTIKTITVEDVRELSQRYFDLQYMSKIIVGDNKITT